MYSTRIVILTWFLYNEASGQLCSQNFTQASVIETPRFPDPYPANTTCEWAWSKSSGKWAVSFEVFDINCRDTLYLKDVSDDKQLPFDCSQKHNAVPVYYTKGPNLILRFHSKRWNSSKQGFRIRVLYGEDIDELKKQVYNQKTKNSVQNVEMYSYYPWLMPMMIFPLIVIGVAIFIIKRRRPARSHTVSVDFLVNDKPQKNSIVFKRTPSASSEEDATTTKVEISRGSVKRSTSVMSWTMRATLSSTSSSNNGGVVDNLYMPMSNDMVNYQNQINKPLPTARRFAPFEKPVSNAHRYPVGIIPEHEYPVINVCK